MNPPLTTTDLTKRYGRGAPVIEGLTHTFSPGTATALVGPNGAGKTTLLRLLAASAFPTSGTAAYGEVDVHARPHAYLRHAGLVHAADEALPQHLTAVELLEWVLRARGRWDSEAPARIARLLDRVGLDERREALIGTYSSGMAGKVQLAAALVHAPGVLLLDEPFRSLDAATTEAVPRHLHEEKAGGAVLVFATRDPAPREALADVTLQMDGQNKLVDGR